MTRRLLLLTALSLTACESLPSGPCYDKALNLAGGDGMQGFVHCQPGQSVSVELVAGQAIAICRCPSSPDAGVSR